MYIKNLTPETAIPCRNETCWKRNAEGQTIIRTANRQLIALAPFGAEIFHCCTGKKSVAKIARTMAARHFHLPLSRVTVEVIQFIGFMHRAGCIVLCTEDF